MGIYFEALSLQRSQMNYFWNNRKELYYQPAHITEYAGEQSLSS